MEAVPLGSPRRSWILLFGFIPAIADGGGSTTREAIRRRFGDTVTAIVDGCTDSDMTPKPPSRHPKEAYIARILTASG